MIQKGKRIRVDKIFEKLKEKLNEMASCGTDNNVSVGLVTRCATMNHIVNADDILFDGDEIRIQSGHLMMNVNCGNGTCITENDYGIETEYYINNYDMELYINILGTE